MYDPCFSFARKDEVYKVATTRVGWGGYEAGWGRAGPQFRGGYSACFVDRILRAVNLLVNSLTLPSPGRVGFGGEGGGARGAAFSWRSFVVAVDAKTKSAE